MGIVCIILMAIYILLVTPLNIKQAKDALAEMVFSSEMKKIGRISDEKDNMAMSQFLKKRRENWFVVKETPKMHFWLTFVVVVG